jgi:hypothetical protein
MNMLGRVLHGLRAWTGFAGASESHLTPSHGWLLPTPADARQGRKDADGGRAALRSGASARER